MKNKLIKFCLILTIFTIIIACSEKKEVKDLAKIQQEKGVPTTTYKVKAETFFTTLLYTASVTGKTQTSVYAMIDAEIEDIHAKVGDFVEKDALIMEFPKNKPSANYIQYKAVYENSEITYERMKNLYMDITPYLKTKLGTTLSIPVNIMANFMLTSIIKRLAVSLPVNSGNQIFLWNCVIE